MTFKKYIKYYIFDPKKLHILPKPNYNKWLRFTIQGGSMCGNSDALFQHTVTAVVVHSSSRVNLHQNTASFKDTSLRSLARETRELRVLGRKEKREEKENGSHHKLTTAITSIAACCNYCLEKTTSFYLLPARTSSMTSRSYC